MATTKITSPDLFDLGSLDSALQLPSGTTAERPTSPSTGEWRFNTDNNLIEFYDGGSWRDLQDEEIPPVPSENFNTVLYTGNGGTQSISSLSFSPSFVWIKRLDATASHFLTFEKEGTGKQWSTNSCAGRTFNTNMITSFDSNGFTLGSNSASNDNAGSYAAWCFNVNGGTSVTNTDGTVNSSVEVNSKTKISIMTYSGNGFSNSTRGHGLGVAPEFVFTRDQNNANCWYVWHKDLGPISGNNYLQFSTSSQASDTSIWSGTVPNNQVITLGNNINVNGSGRAFITFAMASVAGFSKVGSYTGNGSTNGPVVNTGFEPAFLIIKRTDSTSSWIIYDNKRSSSNPREKILYVNLSNAENNSSSNAVDFLTNGFQIKNTSYNANGGTYIYIAFASDTSAAPVLANSYSTNTYTGNSSTQSITGLGFKPNLLWIKNRDTTQVHILQDTIRGAGFSLTSNGTNSTFGTANDLITSFDNDGFTVNRNYQGGTTNDSTNGSYDYVAWAWKANPIYTINTDGTVQSVVSANQAAGFSIVKFTSPPTNTTGFTIGHGLSSTPDLIITKPIDAVVGWHVYSSAFSTPSQSYLQLQSTAAALTGNTNIWNNTAATSTVFSMKTGYAVGTSSQTIAYCFHLVSGFSKIGSYTGTGSSNPITGLGFSPNWVMIKSSTSVENWAIFDTSRGSNVLYANSSAAESAFSTFTFDSDGFTVPAASGMTNGSGQTYIYMALKENPTPYPLAGNMSFLVVAGGASGGRQNAGGGGAGGLRTSYGGSSGGGSSAESDITLASGTYTITVGAGGAALTTNGVGNNGVDSSIAASGLTTITSIGGGGGYGFTYSSNNANSGGSGGGAGTTGSNSASGFGSGTANQGFDGGARFATVNTYAGGGGGGASQAGQASTGLEDGGDGGNGLSVSITGSAVTYAGGGGGGGNTTVGAGGSGGGTAGGLGSGSVADASANTGGGSGGTRDNVTAGSGGSGVVILRLATSEYSGTTTGSPTVTTDGDYTILTYTGSGTYVHS